MQYKFVVHSDYTKISQEIEQIIFNFDTYDEVLGQGDRNVIKIIPVNGKRYTIKSFKVPNLINQIVYRFFRKSKAERSYNYAIKLLSLGIRTPSPLGYYLNCTPLLFKKSYYICELVNCDLTFRELTTNFDIPDHEDILRAFTRFTFELHEKGVNFLDHSPGNTLIKRNENDYEFYLVDLNRMKFGTMLFEDRIKNFAKLTIHKSMIEIMSDEYAKISGQDKVKVFELMWQFTKDFQNRFYRKNRIKKRLFFWKSKYKNRAFDSPI
ncbi:Kdo domain containing protein [Aquimarina sp. W85]|uniref:Kdo domain containing protein n=1 Tax=Aquimarina rhodophyticola TaxID=3342246 RepID=UPI0036702C57